MLDKAFLNDDCYFVVAVGTDLGKTFLVEKICQKFFYEKRPIAAIKPIASGFKNDNNDDPIKIINSLKISLHDLDEITPWRFALPASPHIAAKAEGKEINFTKVVEFCEKKIDAAKKNKKFLLIEGAGGVMSPINDDKVFLDLIAQLKIPTLLLTANYMGSISHSLSAIEALKAKDVLVEKIIFNDFSNQPISNIDMQEAINFLSNYTKIESLGIDEFLLKI